MNIKKLLAVFLTLSVMILPSANAQSFVWKAEKNGRHIYLGGALHLLKKADYPLPGEFDFAYNNSQFIYFETDIEKLKAPKAKSVMLQALQSKTGKTLSQTLQPHTLRMLKAHLEERKLSFKRFNHYSPSGLYIALNSLELARLGFDAIGVDMHFSKRARQQGKARRMLETTDQHLAFLSRVRGVKDDELIMNGLRDMQTMSSTVGLLKTVWRSGDRENFQKHIVNPYRQQHPDAYRVLLVERNKNWIPKIEAMFKTPQVEFVLVGAMHLIGPHGILRRLEAKGYVVDPL